MRDVRLRRLEELATAIAYELRPALAVCDPGVLFSGVGHGS
jgi:hypothetical protein